MPVHPDSVISTEIQDFDPVFYDSLTTKENFCYTLSYLVGTPVIPAMGETFTPYDGTLLALIPRYQAFFSNLDAAILQWRNVDREVRIMSIVSVMYGAVTVVETYDAADPDFTDIGDANIIFGAGGFFEDVINGPDDYYDDMVIGEYVPVPPEFVSPFGDNAPTLKADAVRIVQDIEDEQARVDSVTLELTKAIGRVTHTLMFENKEPIRIITKEELAQKIFVDYHYERVYKALNSGELKIPAYLNLC